MRSWHVCHADTHLVTDGSRVPVRGHAILTRMSCGYWCRDWWVTRSWLVGHVDISIVTCGSHVHDWWIIRVIVSWLADHAFMTGGSCVHGWWVVPSRLRGPWSTRVRTSRLVVGHAIHLRRGDGSSIPLTQDIFFTFSWGETIQLAPKFPFLLCVLPRACVVGVRVKGR